jgi:hypothetical protein
MKTHTHLFLLFAAFSVGCSDALAQTGSAGDQSNEGLAVGEPLPEPSLGRTEERPGGGFINLRVVDSHFRLFFLDAEKKIEAPSLNLGALRYDIVGEDPEFVRLSPQEDGAPYLTHVRFIPKPWVIRVHLVLQKETPDEGDTDKHQEIYNFMLRQ